MARWFITVFILPRERLIGWRSHLENHRACPRQWFVVDESKASKSNRTSERMLDTCRGLDGNVITFRSLQSSEMPDEPIDQSILRAREKIKGRLQVDEEPRSLLILEPLQTLQWIRYTRNAPSNDVRWNSKTCLRLWNFPQEFRWNGCSAFARGNCFSAKGGEIVWRVLA